MKPIWQNPSMLRLLWLLLPLYLIYIYDIVRRRRLLEHFAQPALLAPLVAGVSHAKRRWKEALCVAGLALLIIALARPAWKPIPLEIKSKGRDVVFLLDVSRSMLADDLKPNRLERAKLAIRDCLETLQGDRVGLVLFAGSSVVRCPLTLDYGFFTMMLSDIDTNSVAKGGTMLGDALRKVQKEVFDSQERQYKDIILITDGEDQGSFPVEAAAALGEQGVRLIAVGLGDDHAGTPVMVADDDGRKSLLKYQGEVVRSRLDSNTLRKMAAATPGGRYLPVSTGTVDLGSIYTSLVATAEKRELESRTIERYEETFQIFLAAALLLLCVEYMMGERRRLPKGGTP